MIKLEWMRIMGDEEFSIEAIKKSETSLETAKFVFHQAEECLKSTIVIDDVIDQKLFKIATWAFPVLTGLVVWVLSNPCIYYSSKSGIHTVIALLFLCIATCLVGLFPKLFHISGNIPSNFFNGIIPYSHDEKLVLTESEQTVITILNECEGYQKKIIENTKRSELKSALLKISMTTFFSSPFLGFIVFLF